MVRKKDSGLEQGFDDYFDFNFGELKAHKNNQRFFRWYPLKAKPPFYLWFHYYDPHIPYAAPNPFNTFYDPLTGKSIYERIVKVQGARKPERISVGDGISRYDGEISFMDYHLGKVFAFLAEKGQFENTLFIAVADHGESMYEHNAFFSHGFNIYEPAVRIPNLFLLPGARHGGKMMNTLVETVDLLPTVLQILGLPSAENIQGKDLTPLFDQPEKALRNKTFSRKMPIAPKYFSSESEI